MKLGILVSTILHAVVAFWLIMGEDAPAHNTAPLVVKLVPNAEAQESGRDGEAGLARDSRKTLEAPARLAPAATSSELKRTANPTIKPVAASARNPAPTNALPEPNALKELLSARKEASLSRQSGELGMLQSLPSGTATDGIDADAGETIPITSGNPKYSAYLSIVRELVDKNWSDVVGRKTDGTVVVEFSIAKSGALEAIHIQRTSGFAELDRAAVSAIRSADPFPRIPDTVRRKQSLRLAMLFLYHTE